MIQRASFVIYTATIGVSAFLLFLVQPMISKIILPVFGGGASVWLTGIVFFQLLLFAGYATSNFLVMRLGHSKHLLFQAIILLCSLLFVPFAANYAGWGTSSLPPEAAIIGLLLMTVGMPYFVLSTTSPVVQYWLARDERFANANPYAHYAVSNAGSLAGLLAYPLFIETRFNTGMQTALWAVMFALYAVLLAASIYFSRSASLGAQHREESAAPAPSAAERRGWLFQSMIPSAALIAVTHYLTQDVVNFPLLWVLPLALYLLSFVICFSVPALSAPSRPRALLVLAAVLSLMMFHDGMLNAQFYVKIATAFAGFFALCMFFHGNLERGKPQKGRLTEFYMYVSLGGLTGSILAGVVASALLRTHFEFNRANTSHKAKNYEGYFCETSTTQSVKNLSGNPFC